MASKHSCIVFFLCSMLLVLAVSKAASHPSSHIDVVSRTSFPKGFVFGSSSAAYQYEGAAFKYGKGPSIWDTYTHQHPERIMDRSNGDVAVDQYHRYKEDVGIMNQIGFDAYRFSISWPRILPNGKLSGGVNKKGIEYYNNLINELLAHGIQPYVTLFHWDLPQALQDEYQGFMSHQIVNHFRDYVELCFKEFGDRVKYWITINEPYIFTVNGYVYGQFASGRCSSRQQFNCLGGDSGTEPYIVGHNQLLAHAAAVRVYKTKYQALQKGKIGIALFSNWFVPYSNSREDKKATTRAFDFSLGWFLHPLIHGDYPPNMRTTVKERLPKFTKEETNMMLNSFDFLGLNYYTANYAKHNSNPNEATTNSSYLNDVGATLSTERDGVSIGPKVNSASWLAVYPLGLRNLLIYIKNHYKNPIISITENGFFDPNSSNVHQLINDMDRIKYFRDHLINVHESIKAGVRVNAYFAWTLLDDFEWASGYTIRFGLIYIDFKNGLTRIAKDSAKWFHNFLST